MTDGNATLFRLRWEMVDLGALWKYCNADPSYYKNITQLVPNSQIPDEDWHVISRTGTRGELTAQYNMLHEWAEADKEFVRNVELQQSTTQLQWERVDDQVVES